MICAQALQSAGFSLEPGSFDGLDLSKCGILIGTAMGGMATFSNAVEDLTQKARLNAPQLHFGRVRQTQSTPH